jgi:hypothetical protein
VRIAVDWLFRSDIGEVIKTIVADEAGFPDYTMSKKSTGRKKPKGKKSASNKLTRLRDAQ